jgi:glycosyltransferase involved in cell wall biosynthesis
MSFQPLVSVCIPAYNNARFLPEALESVISQRDINFEVIIIDDCSTDETAAIAHQFALRDPRITVHINEQNLGMVTNWNRCLELAQGTYIKYLFGDDLFSSPDTLRLMVAAMEQAAGTVLVSSARIIIDDQSHPVETVSRFPDKFSAAGQDVIRRCFLKMTRHHNLIGEPSAVLFRRLEAVRGFDPRYNQLVDLEMWFHLLELGNFVYLAEPLCSFRHHDAQQTKKNKAELNFIDDLTYLFADYLRKPYVGLGRLARAYLMYYQFYKLWKHARQGDHNTTLVRERIGHYGTWRFVLMRPFYRLYTPYWRMKRIIAEVLGRE